MPRRLAAIMMADAVSYSRLVAADETGTLETLRSDRVEVFEPEIGRHGGRVVKLIGDGLLAEFPSAVEAVECAIEAQRSLSERNAGRPENRRMTYRIGINLGDVVEEGDDILGDGVNIAARIEKISEPGGLCVSDSIHQNIVAVRGAGFDDLGEQELKNIGRKIRVWRWAGPAATRTGAAALRQGTTDFPSIAILPFVNRSGDADQDFFADGVTEDIIIALSKLNNLRVSARSSSFVYRNAQMPVRRIASELGVRYVLEGSVRKAGDNVRITAQLVDGAEDAQVWAERYDRRLTNIFELQDEISSSIVAALKVSISPRERRILAKAGTHDVEAYERYIRARALLREMTRRSTELARDMFRDAIARDPRYALAHCGLADSLSTMTFHYEAVPEFEGALESSRRALELDPALAEAHAAHGWALAQSGDEVGAEREYKTAIDLEPTILEPYFYMGALFNLRGEADRAHAYYRQAFEISDHDLQSAMMLKNAYRTAGRRDELLDVARRTVAVAEHRLKHNPQDEQAAYVGAMALIDLGDRDRARTWADLALRVHVEDSRTDYNLSCLYSLLGDVDTSLRLLRRTLEMGCSPYKRKWMWIDSDMVNARLDPRFEDLQAEFAFDQDGRQVRR